MKLYRLKSNLSLVQKIALAGLLTALVAIFQKILAVNYVPGLPFLRISFGGPALIIFSSILLGPWFGLLVGGASDILGYFVFDMSGSGWFPQITLIYALLGFSAYFVFQFVSKIKYEKVVFIVESIILALFLCGITMYFVFDNTMETWQKVLFPSAVTVLAILYVVCLIIFHKKVTLDFDYSLAKISLCCFLLDSIVLLGFGTLMKAICFGFEIYPLIFICQLLVLFVNLTINTIVISLLFKINKKRFTIDYTKK